MMTIPRRSELNGKIYNNIGTIILNNCGFLVTEAENQLSYFDFTEVTSLQNSGFKDPSGVEIAFMNYLIMHLQNLVDNHELNDIRDFNAAVVDINKFIHEDNSLLEYMSTKTDDRKLANEIESVISEFTTIMSKNKYFQIKEKVQETESDVEILNFATDAEVQKPVEFVVEETIEPLDFDTDNEIQVPVNFNQEEILEVEQPVPTSIEEVIAQPEVFQNTFEEPSFTPEFLEQQAEFKPVIEEPKFTLEAIETENEKQQENLQTTYEDADFMLNSVQPKVEYRPEVIEPVFQQPDFTLESVIQPVEMQLEVKETIEPKAVAKPEYDEQTVTDILKFQSEKPTPDFDINEFVDTYFNNLTSHQINILLNGFNLDEQRVDALKKRKETIQVLTSLEKAELNKEEIPAEQVGKTTDKRKRFTLFGDKNVNKESAFVDTLLLSFTVGTICGVYLMYFVLTIMS